MTRFATLGLGIAALAAVPAYAGGPVVPAPEPVVVAPVPLAPSPLFAGGYVGGGIGYAFGGSDDVGIDPDTFDSFRRGELELKGPVGEVHTGYRWQQPGSRVVYGVEAMATLGEVQADEEVGNYKSSSVVKWAATLKGTLGYTVRPDTLLYGFAGYSVGRSEYDVVGPLGVINEDRDLDGYVVGLGLEKLLDDRWSVRGEYQYSNYGKEDIESGNGRFSTNDTPEYHTLTVGVNYRF